MIYKMNKNYKVDFSTIEKLIIDHQKEVQRQKKLEQFYLNGSGVLDKTMENGKPNNKLINNYASYITEIMTGYFLGKPVNITSENVELLEVIKKINKYNDEASHNSSLAKRSSIGGYCYELLYNPKSKIEEDKIRFTVLDNKEIIYVVDNTVEENPLFAVRYYKNQFLDDVDYFVEVYDNKYIYYYSYSSKKKDLSLDEKRLHGYGDVPVVLYKNNEFLTGDFEKVLSLIENYDYMASWDADNFEYYTDAILVLYGMMNMEVDEEGNTRLPDFKQKKFVNIRDMEGKLEWLVKPSSGADSEVFKTRLQKDIHKFSHVPDITDESFGTQSGIAMRYKLMATETVRATKEQYFKKGLTRRNELICNRLRINNNLDKMNEIEFIFTANIPDTLSENILNAKNAEGVLSRKTQIEIAGFDSEVELERILEEEEKEAMAYKVNLDNLMLEDNLDEEDKLEEDR